MAERVRSGIKVFVSWDVKEKIGEGTYSEVYLLEKSIYGIKDTSVLKVIDLYEDFGRRTDLSKQLRDEMKERIEQEVTNAGKEVALLRQFRGSTHIVDFLDFEVYDWEEEDCFGTSLLIRMEKLDNLAEEQRRGKTFTYLEIVRMGKDICSALMFCHGKNILHRDIKPANIYRNEDGHYKLGDFGISRILDNAQKKSMRESVGTKAYMAPEQYKGEDYDFRADIYSLGLVMYELVNGNRLPFAKGTVVTEEELIQRIVQKEVPPLEWVDGLLADPIRIACCYHPEGRYESAEKFYDDLCFSESMVRINMALAEATPEMRRDFYESLSIKPDSVIEKEQKEFAALLQIAEQGDAKAQYFVGMYFLAGKMSVPRDQQKGLEWIRKAAEQGNSYAQCTLGEMYMTGLAVEENQEEAIGWLEKSVKQKNTRAMFYMGSIHERMAESFDGNMVEANAYMSEAKAWYKLAAEHGDKLGKIAVQRLQI